MAEAHSVITAEQADLIEHAVLFFVASADPDMEPGPTGQGPVNLSPKGGVPLHIIDERRVAYLDYAGSGNQTMRHSAKGGPVTVMVMSSTAEDAAIVRLFGHASATPLDESPLADRLREAGAEHIELPERQVIEVRVDHTETSCGYGVPILAYGGERTRAGRGRRYKQ